MENFFHHFTHLHRQIQEHHHQVDHHHAIRQEFDERMGQYHQTGHIHILTALAEEAGSDDLSHNQINTLCEAVCNAVDERSDNQPLSVFCSRVNYRHIDRTQIEALAEKALQCADHNIGPNPDLPLNELLAKGADYIPHDLREKLFQKETEDFSKTLHHAHQSVKQKDLNPLIKFIKKWAKYEIHLQSNQAIDQITEQFENLLLKTCGKIISFFENTAEEIATTGITEDLAGLAIAEAPEITATALTGPVGWLIGGSAIAAGLEYAAGTSQQNSDFNPEDRRGLAQALNLFLDSPIGKKLSHKAIREITKFLDYEFGKIPIAGRNHAKNHIRTRLTDIQGASASFQMNNEQQESSGFIHPSWKRSHMNPFR